MIINGLNKLTLLDYPGLTACTVFIGGCNFRCPFCHNAPLVLDNQNQPVILDKELFGFLEKRKKVLDGVCVTGGEPSLNKDLPAFIKKIKDMGYKVKLDTNGSNPEMLQTLIESQAVDYVAMDIKNSPEKYGKTIGKPGFDISAVKASAQILLSSAIQYEFRTTAVKEFHDEDSFIKISEWLSSGTAYYIQQFEDRGNLIGQNLSPCAREEMYRFLEIVKPYFKTAGIRGID